MNEFSFDRHFQKGMKKQNVKCTKKFELVGFENCITFLNSGQFYIIVSSIAYLYLYQVSTYILLYYWKSVKLSLNIFF